MATNLRQVSLSFGTEDNPMVLTSDALETLVALNDDKILQREFSGWVFYANITESQRRALQAQGINVKFNTISADTFTIAPVNKIMDEGNSVDIIPSGINVTELTFAIESISIISADTTESEIMDKFTINGNRLSCKAPEVNDTWTADITIKAYPTYDPNNVKTCEVQYKSVAITEMLIVGNDEVAAGGIDKYTTSPNPAWHTKVIESITWSAQYGSINPSGVYTAPENRFADTIKVTARIYGKNYEFTKDLLLTSSVLSVNINPKAFAAVKQALELPDSQVQFTNTEAQAVTNKQMELIFQLFEAHEVETFDQLDQFTKVDELIIGSDNTHLTHMMSRHVLKISGSGALKAITNVDDTDFPSVTEIGDGNLFYGNTFITTASFPALADIRVTDNNIFRECTRLATVSLPSLYSIIATQDNRMFQDSTQLKEIIFDNVSSYNVTRHDFMCYGCTALTKFNMSKVTRLYGSGDISLFRGCNKLVNVTMTIESITSTGGTIAIFDGCTALPRIELKNLTTISCSKGTNAAFRNCLQIVNVNLDALSIFQCSTNNMFVGCNNLTSLSLPSASTYQVTSSDNICQNCNAMQSVSMPLLEKIESTGDLNMFYGCTSLNSVNMPKLKSISCSSNQIFRNCTMMQKIELPIEVITCSSANNMFYGCSLLNNVKLESLTTLDGSNCNNYMFSGCTGIVSIALDNLTTINGNTIYMFNDCTALKNVSMPLLESIECMGANYMFQNSGIEIISLPILKRISSSSGTINIFYKCSKLKEIHFAELTEITTSGDNYLLYNLPELTTLDYPKLEMFIGKSTRIAYLCSKVTNITLPSLKNITATGTNYAFTGNTALTEVHLPAIETISCATNNMFQDCSALRIVDFGRYSDNQNPLSISGDAMYMFPASVDIKTMDDTEENGGAMNNALLSRITELKTAYFFTGRTFDYDIVFPNLVNLNEASGNQLRFYARRVNFKKDALGTMLFFYSRPNLYDFRCANSINQIRLHFTNVQKFIHLKNVSTPPTLVACDCRVFVPKDDFYKYQVASVWNGLVQEEDEIEYFVDSGEVDPNSSSYAYNMSMAIFLHKGEIIRRYTSSIYFIVRESSEDNYIGKQIYSGSYPYMVKKDGYYRISSTMLQLIVVFRKFSYTSLRSSYEESVAKHGVGIYDGTADALLANTDNKLFPNDMIYWCGFGKLAYDGLEEHSVQPEDYIEAEAVELEEYYPDCDELDKVALKVKTVPNPAVPEYEQVVNDNEIVKVLKENGLVNFDDRVYGWELNEITTLPQNGSAALFDVSKITDVSFLTKTNTTIIPAYMLYYANKVKTVIIPSTVTDIRSHSLRGMTALSKVVFLPNTCPEIHNNILTGSTCPIHVNIKAYDGYVESMADFVQRIIGYNCDCDPTGLISERGARVCYCPMSNLDIIRTADFEEGVFKAVAGTEIGTSVLMRIYDAQGNYTTETWHVDSEMNIVRTGADAMVSTVNVEESSNPLWTRGGMAAGVDAILNTYGTYVIDPVHKKYARLDPTNHNYFADGTPWSGAYGDSFRRFPRVYYKMGDDKVLHVSKSPIEGGHYWDETFIGTYKGSVDADNKLHSRPGVASTNSKTMTQFWTYAQNLGRDYGLVDYFDHCELNALHLAKFGDANSERTMGGGLQSAGADYYTATTGATSALGDETGGMTYGDTTHKQNKLFGIEALAGQTWEFRPNIRFTDDESIVYEGNIVSNTAEGVRTFARQPLTSGYVKNMVLGEHFDMIPSELGGSSSTYWCDYGYAQAGGQLLVVGGSSSHGASCGLSASVSSHGFGVASANFGCRLAFKGDIRNYELISGEALKALNQ